MEKYPEDGRPNIEMDDHIYDPVAKIWWQRSKKKKMKKIIAEAELVQATSQSNLFLVDDGLRGLYMNLKVASKAAEALKPHVGQIITISVEVPEELPCCSPNFEEYIEELVLKTIRGLFEQASKNAFRCQDR